MKILVLTIEYPPLGGGASPMIHETNKNYVLLGHQVTVVTMGFRNLPSEETIDGVLVFRVNCNRSKVHLSYPFEHFLFILRAKRKLNSLLKAKKDFDVCHTHFMMPTGMLSRWLKNKFYIPYIITIHGSDIPGFNPHRFLFMHRFTPPLIRSIIDSSSYIVTPSLYLGELLKKHLKFGQEKIVRIPNGVDTNQFKPSSKKPIILSSGRLLERKGFRYLLQAVMDKDLGYELHILGDGPLMSELKKLASGSGTPVTFHGWMDNRSIHYRTLLSEASIYCLVSTNENASISLVEAMASGCAVITSDISGCPETVGETGICITPENPGLLKEVLKQVIDHPQRREILMSLARERAVRQFHSPTLAMEYLNLLSSVTAHE